MNEFRISEAALARNKIRFTGLFILIALGIVLYTCLEKYRETGSIPQSSIVIAVIIFVVILAVAAFTALPKINDHLKNFSLTFYKDHIVIRDKDDIDYKIPHSEIAELVMNHNGSVVVKGKEAAVVHLISKDIENYEVALAKLNRIKTIQPNGQEAFSSLYMNYILSFYTLVFILMMAFRPHPISFVLYALFAACLIFLYLDNKKNPYTVKPKENAALIMIGVLVGFLYYLLKPYLGL